MNLKEKIGIVYLYEEVNLQQKSQTNLSFFIKYGLDKTKWRNIDIKTLIVVNNHCEVLIPQNDSIYVLNNFYPSCLYGFKNGIKWFEDKFKSPIHEQFTHLCLIDSSSIGPIHENDVHIHWLDPFLNKIKDNDDLITNQLKKGDNEEIYCEPTFIIVKPTNQIVSKIRSHTECADLSYNISNIMNDMKINPQCFINENELIHFYKTQQFDCAGFECLKQNIFIENPFKKNLYKSMDLYKMCLNFTYKKLNISLLDIYSEHDYSLLKPPNPKILFQNNKQPITDDASNNDFFAMYTFANEIITFPKTSQYNKSCAIYIHYDEDNIIKDYVIQSLRILIELKYDVMFYTTSEKLLNIDENILPIKIEYVKNLGPGSDYHCWLNGLKKISSEFNNKYEWIMLLNDSLLLGINGVSNMYSTIQTMRSQGVDLWGHWDSSDVNYHYLGVPIEFKTCLVKPIIDFIEHNITLCKSYWDYVLYIETKLIYTIRKMGFKTNVIIHFGSLKNICPTASHNPLNLHCWINNTNSFAIKWKYSLGHIMDENIKSEHFKFLTRYLCTGDNVIISKGEKQGSFINQTLFKRNKMFYN